MIDFAHVRGHLRNYLRRRGNEERIGAFVGSYLGGGQRKIEINDVAYRRQLIDEFAYACFGIASA